MYMTMRRMRCAPGRLNEVLALGVPLVQDMNERHGASLAVGVEIGGDPDGVGLSGAWETLGAFQDFREAYAADEDLVARGAKLAPMLAHQQDQIGKVLAAPGERAPFSVLNEARMHMPRIVEAIPLGLEICELVEDKTGIKAGFVTAVTGDQSSVAWVSRFASLDAAADANDTLEADADYLDLFKRADGIFVDGSLTQSIYQMVL